MKAVIQMALSRLIGPVLILASIAAICLAGASFFGWTVETLNAAGYAIPALGQQQTVVDLAQLTDEQVIELIAENPGAAYR